MRVIRWSLLGVVVLSAALWMLYRYQAPPPAPAQGPAVYPWQVHPTREGNSEVFGIQIGADTLRQVEAVFGPRMELSVFEGPEGLSLEAFYAEVTRGGLSARLVFSTALPRKRLRALRAQAVKTEQPQPRLKRYVLSRAAAHEALNARVSGLTYLPAADLSDDVVRHRFGPPAQVVSGPEHARHYLYPSLGVDVVLNKGGTAVVQYVPPRDFARLRAPLTAPAQQPAR